MTMKQIKLTKMSRTVWAVCTLSVLGYGLVSVADTVLSDGVTVSGSNRRSNGGGTLDYGVVSYSGVSTYSGNTSTGFSHGGALYAGSMSQAGSGSFSGNTAAGGSGGAVYSRGNVSIGADSVFADNAAASHGGALCLDANDPGSTRTVTIESGTQFTGNSAGLYGGAVYVAGLSVAEPTVLTLHSQDTDKAIVFSGNYSGRAVGASLGGTRNSLMVMNHVAVVLTAEAGCRIDLSDPVDSFEGYSGGSSLLMNGAGEVRFGGGVSRCCYPVSLVSGTMAIDADSRLEGMASLTVSSGASVRLAVDTNATTAPLLATGAVALQGDAVVNVELPALPATGNHYSFVLAQGSSLSKANGVSVIPNAVSGADWLSSGTFSTSVTADSLVLNWARTIPPYDGWTENHFPDGTADDQKTPMATPAGDGIPNLLKYATGKDPMTPCGAVAEVSTVDVNGKRYLQMTWDVNPEAVDIVYHVDFSNDLENWVETYEVEVTGTTGSYRDSVAIDPASDMRRFMRLRVTQTEQ